MSRTILAKAGLPEGSARQWRLLAWAALCMIALMAAVPGLAQDGVETFDPDQAYALPADQPEESVRTDAIDADLVDPDSSAATQRPAEPSPVPDGPVEVETSRAEGFDGEFAEYAEGGAPGVPAEELPQWTEQGSDTGEDVAAADPSPRGQEPGGSAASADTTTYGEDDLIGAAEGVFGKGAEGLAGLIEDLLRKQGEPNGYIVGREAGGAFIVGARYGSGTLHHKVEGKRKVYWTGPSIGFDAGANAGNTFVLVYNLFDTEDLFKRFPAGEGQAYFVGGLTASYLRKGDIVLIPIRVGAGVRLGVNAGYMKFSKKQKWLPF